MTPAADDAAPMQPKLDELCGLLLARESIVCDVPALARFRVRLSRRPTAPTPVMFEPMLYFVLQGGKRLTLGERSFEYHGGSLIVMSVDLPATGQVIKATDRTPYMALELLIDSAAVAALLPCIPERAAADAQAFSIDALPFSLLDPLTRLVRLFDESGDAAVLGPMIEREILYRVLQAPQGATLGQLARPGSRLARIGRAIVYMRAHVAEPLRVESLASIAGMSATTFHRHFKAVTSMSPLAYHKQIRLQEARRRLLAELGGTAEVAVSVGYGSASQFSREYKREFGSSPGRDAASHKEEANAKARSVRSTAYSPRWPACR